MKGRLTAAVYAALLLAFGMACGGGGGGGGEPGFRFRSLSEDQSAVEGQYVLVWGIFSNIPSSTHWAVFYDTDEDYDNGHTLVEDGGGTGFEVLKLWDTTGAAAGVYYVGVAADLDGETLVTYADGKVTVTAGTPPTIEIIQPAAAAEYARGDLVALEADLTGGTGYSWELFAAFDKDPLVRAVNIASLPETDGFVYDWDTGDVDPGSYYIGFLARKGDVWTFAFTDFLITIAVHDKWVPLSLEGAPGPREDHRAVWTGTEMLVWGGQGSAGSLVTGGRYTPWSNSWTTMTTENVPAARYDFTATWCGDRMIVWGGRGSTGYMNTGAAYFPDEDRWEPITTDGAPSPRANHTAVWTGGRLVIWGGEGPTGFLNDGGVYDPATDSWTPIPSGGAPSGRADHTAVWTGGGMIIWGGRNIAPMQEGAYWDAGTGTWTAISDTGAPSARWDHYAAYLPSLGMVVWGGRNSFAPLSDGAVYDPGTDTWTAIDDTDAPLPAYDPQVVLCGRKLFVWGGFLYTYRTGAKVYDFDAGEWIAADTEDEPIPAMLGTAVWTGGVVIVWGGRTTTGTTNMGGYYFLP